MLLTCSGAEYLIPACVSCPLSLRTCTTAACPLCCLPHPQALKTGKSERAATRIGKMPAMADFQFFNTRRLTELYEREHAAEQHKQLMAQKEANLRGQVRA